MYFGELENWKVVPYRFSTKGKVIVKPYSNSDSEVTPVCRKIIGQYKVLIHKTWAGNGFGYDSLIFVFDTQNDVVRIVNTSTYTDVVRYLERRQEQSKGE